MQRKRLLLIALDAGGVVFDGPNAQLVNGRACRVLLRSIAGRLRGDRLQVGVVASAAQLGVPFYRERRAQQALRALQDAGVIRRVEQPGRRATHQPPSLNYIHPEVINAGAAWARLWHEQGPHRPENRVLKIPIVSTMPSGNTELARTPGAQGAKSAPPQGAKNAQGLIHTPPAFAGAEGAEREEGMRKQPRG